METQWLAEFSKYDGAILEVLLDIAGGDMFRVRFHGRGGQGVKTASRVLGSAFFREGYTVQDAPRYGAERRGAPISAYVRACQGPVYERGVIREADLVVVTDDTLMTMPAAGVLQGVDEQSGLLVASSRSAEYWRHRLGLKGAILTVRTGGPGTQTSIRMAAAAAGWLGVISRDAVSDAVRDELAPLGNAVLQQGLRAAATGCDDAADVAAMIPRRDRIALQLTTPTWANLKSAQGRRAVPSIFAEATSLMTRTGLWRTMRPVINPARCRRCWWVCSNFCPDGAIRVDDGPAPAIDLDYCKGCAICVVQCPHDAIDLTSERVTEQREAHP